MKQNKRIYESPTMEVVELKSRQMLLAGSQLDKYEKDGNDDLWSD